MGPWEPWAVDARRRALTHSPRPPRYLLLLTSHSGPSNIPSHKTNPAPVSLVDPAQFEYSENVNPRFFSPKKAKFVSKKPTLTKMAPFGLMATIWICMGLCSFAEIGSALPQRGLAGHVASART